MGNELTEEQLAGLDKRIRRLIEERNTAMSLAEQAESKIAQLHAEMEKHLEEGYQEAFEALNEQRHTIATLETENEELKKMNDHLLKAEGIKKPLAESLIQELEAERSLLAKKYGELYNEYEERVREKTEVIVNKLDEFLREKYQEKTAEEVKALVEKGGKTLVVEALGEEGVKILEAIEKKAKEDTEFQELKKKNKIEEAQKMRKQYERQKKRALAGGKIHSGIMGAGKTMTGGMTPFDVEEKFDLYPEKTVRTRVSEIVDKILGENLTETTKEMRMDEVEMGDTSDTFICRYVSRKK